MFPKYSVSVPGPTIWSKLLKKEDEQLKCFSLFEKNKAKSNQIWSKSKEGLHTFNPFFPNAPLLYPFKTLKKPWDFLMFAGARERVHCEQMR